jgi:hypothetical protein
LYIESKGQKDCFLGCETYGNPSCTIYYGSLINPTSESRYTQQCSLKVSPVQTSYSPDGRALLYASAGHQLFFMTLGKEGEETKEQWHPSERDAVRVNLLFDFFYPYHVDIMWSCSSQDQRPCLIMLGTVLFLPTTRNTLFALWTTPASLFEKVQRLTSEDVLRLR